MKELRAWIESINFAIERFDRDSKLTEPSSESYTLNHHTQNFYLIRNALESLNEELGATS